LPATGQVFGFQVSFSNLNSDVDVDDIKEVAQTAGQVNHVQMEGRRRAVVTYARFLDAKNAVETLHMRTLDGTPMQVVLISNDRGVNNGSDMLEPSSSDYRTARARRTNAPSSGLPLSKFSAMSLEREGALKPIIPSSELAKGRGFKDGSWREKDEIDIAGEISRNGRRERRHRG